MRTSTKVFTVLALVIALLLFLAAGLVWQLALRKERMAKPVLEKTIHFEEGFSLTDKFAVAFAGVYWVEVVCPRTYPLNSNYERVDSALSKQLPIKFTITCDGKVVAEGDSPDRLRVASAKEDTRVMAMFYSELGKSHELSFRNYSDVPDLRVTETKLRIKLSQGTTIQGLLLFFCTPFLAGVIAVLGLIFALSPWCFWRRSVIRHKS